MPGGQIFSKHATFRNRSYLPGDWLTITPAANYGHRFAMYYPTADGTSAGAPPGGWPVSIIVNNTGFTNSEEAYADGDNEPIENANGEEMYWYALMHGHAVASVQVPAYTADVLALDDHDGSTPITGGTKNLIHLPGNLYRYYEGGTLAAIDGNGGLGYLNAFNCMVHAIQHIRYYATLLNINPEKVDIGGISGGSCTAAWVAFAPNRAGELGTGGQYEMSTVPNSFHCIYMTLLYYRHWATSYADMAAMLPTSEGTATVNTAWTQAADPSQVPSRYRDDISTWATLPGFTDEHVPPFVWQCSDPVTTQDTHIHEPFRQGFSSTGHDPWTGLVMRNRFKGKGKLWLGPTTITAHDATNKLLCDGELEDVGAAALANKTTNDFVKEWIPNIHKPRWDTSMPTGGIRRRGQVETVGRVCVPANPIRGGVIVACRPGGSSIRVGEGSGAEADYEIQPGEKAYIPTRAHLWIRSVTGVGYFNAREVEREQG